jgi:methenyltetrahydrofolate cyclohydrolase
LYTCSCSSQYSIPAKGTMETFLKVLDPEDTSTGGGSASAIAGAMAACASGDGYSICRICQNRREGEQSFLDRIHAQADELSRQLQEGSREDALSFQAVRSAYRLPKQSPDEKASRQKAVQTAWQGAARVPMENAERCLQVYERGAELSGRVNPKVQSDYRCALLLARAGLLGCLENVHINLPEIKDPNLAEQMTAQAEALTDRLAVLDALNALEPPAK